MAKAISWQPRFFGAGHKTLWRTPHDFVAFATNIYGWRHKPHTINTPSLFCQHILPFLSTQKELWKKKRTRISRKGRIKRSVESVKSVWEIMKKSQKYLVVSQIFTYFVPKNFPRRIFGADDKHITCWYSESIKNGNVLTNNLLLTQAIKPCKTLWNKRTSNTSSI